MENYNISQACSQVLFWSVRDFGLEGQEKGKKYKRDE